MVSGGLWITAPPRMVLRKSTNGVVSLEGKPHTHTYRDSLQEQIRAYGRPWGVPICTVTSEVLDKASPPKSSPSAQGPPRSAGGTYQPILQG